MIESLAVRRVVSAVGLLVATSVATADTRFDCEAVRCAVIDTLDAQCACGDAETHGGYVSCVARTVGQLAQDGAVPPPCKGPLKRCAARSLCGRPADAVVCELPVRCPVGTCSRCRIAPSAERCVARRGTVASRPSCCPTCEPNAPIPCGSLTCDGATEICVSHQPVGPAILYACEPVPAGCELDRTCACAAKTLCEAPFDVCSDVGEGAIDCGCPLCQ